MRLPTLVATALLLVSAGRAADDPSADAREFRALIDRYWKLWSTLDPDKAAPLYSKDTDAVFYDLAPLKFIGWNAYRAGVTKAYRFVTSASFAANADLKVTRRGGVVWTTSTFHGTIVSLFGSVQVIGRHTAIWEKPGDTWIIVHEHLSVPQSR